MFLLYNVGEVNFQGITIIFILCFIVIILFPCYAVLKPKIFMDTDPEINNFHAINCHNKILTPTP